MCGIIGILGQGDVADDVLSTLQRLEYRGYDSAGIATQDEGGLYRTRAAGKLIALTKKLALNPLVGSQGIGHTRWATHGAATEINAHPHISGPVCLVHNGIIENYRQLANRLTSADIKLVSDTDTEIATALIHQYLITMGDPVAAFSKALKDFEGAFSLVVMLEGEEDLLLVARRGSPLAVTSDDKGGVYVGSDAIALDAFSQTITYLNDGDWGVLRRGFISLYNEDDKPVSRPQKLIDKVYAVVDKGNYPHFMLKEIYEQPEVAARTFAHFVDFESHNLRADVISGIDWLNLSLLHIVGCGTAFYSGLVGKHWLEQLGRLPSITEVASEYRYGQIPMSKHGVSLMISQSGETADTCASLRFAQSHGQKVVGVVNVASSSIAREADLALPTAAGVEVGVASSKAFVCQLVTLAVFSLMVGKVRGTLDANTETDFMAELRGLSSSLNAALTVEASVIQLVKKLHTAKNIFFLGRGTGFALAQEGALKLKELSYIHAEAYPSGELKHGPIALIDEQTPSVVIAPSYEHFDKLMSNVREIKARGGLVYLITDAKGAELAKDDADGMIIMPGNERHLWPICYAIPLQLLAYHAARLLGTDVDQPRNLAKSVTVE